MADPLVAALREQMDSIGWCPREEEDRTAYHNEVWRWIQIATRILEELSRDA